MQVNSQVADSIHIISNFLNSLDINLFEQLIKTIVENNIFKLNKCSVYSRTEHLNFKLHFKYIKTKIENKNFNITEDGGYLINILKYINNIFNLFDFTATALLNSREDLCQILTTEMKQSSSVKKFLIDFIISCLILKIACCLFERSHKCLWFIKKSGP